MDTCISMFQGMPIPPPDFCYNGFILATVGWLVYTVLIVT